MAAPVAALTAALQSSPDSIAPQSSGSGTNKLSHIAIILAGIASLTAILLSVISIWFQFKNYRKPLLQRYVVRILMMVPIYALASWLGLVSLNIAQFVDPIRDMYEAFTIYTFFQLLVNFIGGERSLIIMMHGRPPTEHVWPLNYIFPKVDISDPHTFLAVKRGILQYAWLKPPLAIAAIAMKATGTYQEGYIGLSSGYFWSGLIYNISVTVSLYSLGMFWVCMSRDLQPFRPVPKFLCVKLIIFASYWQGFFLSILVWLGVIHDVGHYTPDNIAKAIQDVLICFELPGFAIAHWYAFSWKDYADFTISAARLPVYYALRDSFGIRDLIEDTKITFRGGQYQYRHFDPGEGMAHPESNARVARMMEGLRYQHGGKDKYWIPKPTTTTGLLASPGPSDVSRQLLPSQAEQSDLRAWKGANYGAIQETEIDKDDEALYTNARALEFGDYNYPVITANRPAWEGHRCSRAHTSTTLTTPSTNQALLRPALKKVTSKARKGKANAGSKKSADSKPLLTRSSTSASSTSSSSSRSGLVDLIVEDHSAEDIDRARARKEGGVEWNAADPKRFVRTYPPELAGEEFREGGVDPPDTPPVETHGGKNEIQGSPEGSVFSVGREEDEEEVRGEENRDPRERWNDEEAHSPWREQEEEHEAERKRKEIQYGSFSERGVWGER